MRFQIHSDIHLEKYPHRRIQSKSSHLILAGDIGVPLFDSYHRFILDVSRNFDQIIYVAGNHEYERCWMGVDKNNELLLETKFTERKNLITEILHSFSNIKFLDNQSMKMGTMTLYGTTLWCDYSNKSKKLSTQDFITKQHHIAIQHLNQSSPDVFVSHYVSNRLALDKPWNMGLGINEPLTFKKQVFGHIHYSIHKKMNPIEVICNPWGSEIEEKYVFLDLD